MTSKDTLPQIQIIDIGHASRGWDEKVVMEADLGEGNAAALQLELAEHIGRFGTTAKGKTQPFTKQFAHRASGMGWREAWTSRLATQGHKSRLPRGFKMS